MILILGGTAEARELAAALVAAGHPVLSSLAGRVSRPALPAGEVRVGGFGGVEGLAAFLRERRIAAVVDATHPFAARISANAAAAAEAARCPLLRVQRPSWREYPAAESWTWVADADAARAAADHAQRPFLTTGRQSLTAFLPWADRDVLVRVVDPSGVAAAPTVVGDPVARPVRARRRTRADDRAPGRRAGHQGLGRCVRGSQAAGGGGPERADRRRGATTVGSWCRDGEFGGRGPGLAPAHSRRPCDTMPVVE